MPLEKKDLLMQLQLFIGGHIPFITVDGEDYKTEDKTPVRDFVHVNDVAKGFTAVLRRQERGQFGKDEDSLN